MRPKLKIINEELSFKPKQTSSWKNYQLQFMNAADIDIDHKLKQFMLEHPSWVFNLDHASPDIQQFAEQNQVKESVTDFDFFIISNLEFGKNTVLFMETLITHWYNISRHGGYFSFQSYYLNWENNPNGLRMFVDDNMDIAVEQWVEQCLGISNYTNDSLTISDPLKRLTPDGIVIAGADFMYTHGNTRFWLWKK